jgi:hypothetical protein
MLHARIVPARRVSHGWLGKCEHSLRRDNRPKARPRRGRRPLRNRQEAVNRDDDKELYQTLVAYLGIIIAQAEADFAVEVVGEWYEC